MKTLLVLLTIMSAAISGEIPLGKYKVEKIQCNTGKVMKLGGKFMVYEIFLEVKASEMIMTAHAKSGSWAPFKLDCEQVNRGQYIYAQEGKFEGELPNISAKCNSPTWTRILKKKLFGVEEWGVFNYTVKGDKLEIFNPETVTKYSCDKTGGYPVYYYKKLR